MKEQNRNRTGAVHGASTQMIDGEKIESRHDWPGITGAQGKEKRTLSKFQKAYAFEPHAPTREEHAAQFGKAKSAIPPRESDAFELFREFPGRFSRG